MADLGTPREEPTWIREPPGPREVHLHVTAGPDVELSDTARQALEDLIAALQNADVSGFTDCGTFLTRCKPYTCTLDNCQPLVSQPCFIDADCRIAEFQRM